MVCAMRRLGAVEATTGHEFVPDDLIAHARAPQQPGSYRRVLRASRDALAADAAARALLADRLKAEADRFWAIDPHVSLRLARAIVLLGHIAGDLKTIALGTMARADALRLLGNPRFATGRVA